MIIDSHCHLDHSNLFNKLDDVVVNAKKNEVFVGRIRKDFTLDKTLNLWITADNLRKGAATNAVQIAEYIIKKKII